MKEPERLLAGEASPLERKLLLAMAEERPSAELATRMARGLSSASVAVGKTAGLAALGKGSALLVLALGAGAAAVLGSRSTPTTLPARAPITRGAQASDAERVAEPAPSAQPSSAETVTSPASFTNKTVNRSVPAEVWRRADGDIAAEIRLLDTAKRQLNGGNPAGAMAVLDDYRARFPKGALGQEATVLRIEALAKSGQLGTAQALARRFVRNHPSSTYVRRVSRSVGGLDTETPQRSGAQRK
ncbi:MAG: outer membrane protein assembly factor BamD [Polyangiaceae bacterium]|nr:outer membrane protein assembly factor BamD [Polyangiaceae bacterium]